MPRLNRTGELWCAGIAGAGFNGGDFVNDQLRVLVSVSSAGMRAFLNEEDAITQVDDGATIINCRTGIRSPLGHIAGEVFAGSNVWATFLAFPPLRPDQGVRTSTGLVLPEAYVGAGTGPLRNDCVGPDGTMAIKERYHSFGPWHLYRPDGSQILLTSGDAANIQLFEGGGAIYRIGWEWFGVGVPKPQPLTPIAWHLKMFMAGGEWWLHYQTGDGRVVAHPNGSSSGYLLGMAPDAFGADVAVLADGRLRSVWATNEGETVPSLVVRYARLTDPRVSLGSAGPVDPPPPQGDEPMIRAFSHFGWVTTYFGVGKYGDTPDPIGNCTLFVEWKNDQNQQMLVRDLERLVTPGSRHVRLIIHGDGPSEIPERFINQTVAWWCSGGNIDELGAAVERCRRRPERPILAYLDGRGWPESKPVWLDGRVRANAQLYRFPNEPMDQFTGQCSVMMQRLRSYGQLFGASARFDDFNGDGSVQQTIECMPFYEFAIREYLLVDWLMFADRRQGVKNGRPIGGMNLYPELRAWGSAFDYAFPETPNRFNYWTPNGVDMWTQIENLFGQSRLAVGLESRHRRFLLALKGTAPSDPVDPPPVDPVDPPSNGDSSPDTSALAAFVVDRWKALGVPQQTAAIADRFPYRDEDDDDFKKAQDAASEPEFRALQAGAFHKIIGEWYWSRLSDTVKVMLVPKTGGTNHNNLAEDTFVIGVPDRWLWYADAIQACGHRAAQPKPGYSMTKSGEPNRWAVPPRP